MSGSPVAFDVERSDERPRVDVHYEWEQHALWLSGRYGLQNIDGHEIGLSPGLVADLRAWGDAQDELFDHDDPANSPSTRGFLENGFALALRVRAELAAEWVITATDPVTRVAVALPLER